MFIIDNLSVLEVIFLYVFGVTPCAGVWIEMQRRGDIERVHQHGRYHAQYPAHSAHVFCAPEILCGEYRPGGYYGRIRALLVKTLDKFSVG